MSVTIRPFRRSDREQLTALVNAHIAAVVPGVSVSVSTVLSQLEREPGEFIVDPWVVERDTLVAELRGSVVAAAHLLRYGTGAEVGPDYRSNAEIRWLVCSIDASFRPDASAAGEALVAACVERLGRAWGATRLLSDPSLPAPAAYGVPEQWPHVAALLEGAGFRPGREEIVFLAAVDELPRVAAPSDTLSVTRSLGINGTRFTAISDGSPVAYIKVSARTDAARDPRLRDWADVGNLHVLAHAWRGRGLERWLVGEAAAWLALGGVTRLLDYADAADDDDVALIRSLGFRELTRTRRGWTREA